MGSIDNLADDIRAYCQTHANPTQAARYARYFTEGYDAWGIDGKSPLWSAQIEQWFEQNRSLGLNGFLKLGEVLFARGKYEEGGVGIQLLARFNDELNSSHIPGIASWFEAGVRNWGHTDVLCGLVLSPVLAGGGFQLEDFSSWRDSKFKYQRRAVPVSMLGLLKIKTRKTLPLLRFIEPLLRDPEKVVQQGSGWFLREAWKREPAPVEKFLLAHKDEAPRVIIQYATEKMTPEKRALYKATKRTAARARA
jgi:3-methyladenine DNA glycosylase AlkD